MKSSYSVLTSHICIKTQPLTKNHHCNISISQHQFQKILRPILNHSKMHTTYNLSHLLKGNEIK